MTRIEVDRKELLTFLSSFGKQVTDLRVNCAGNRVVVEIGYSTHYLRKQLLGVNVVDEGFIHIMELEKAVAFLKSAKSDKVVLRQESTGKFLYIVAGGNKIQLPSTDDIISASKTVVQGKLVAKSADSGWKSFAGEIIDTHVTVQTKDLISLSGMKNLVKKDSQFKLRVHCGEEELGIVAGKAVTGRLFTVLPVTDTDGPNATVQTNFGDWFPTCLQYLDEGSARLHFADNSLVIFEQNNTLLLITNEAE